MSRIESLSVVLPTYNEAANLRLMVATLHTLPFPDLRILVVDDNSPDGTGKLAEDLARDTGNRISVIRRPGKLGLGSAYRTGFRAALAERTQAVVQMDCDFSHPPDALPRMAEALEQSDVVVGSRYTAGGSVDARWDFGRRLLSRWGSVYSRTILGLRVQDTTAGYKMWRHEALQGIGLDRIHSNGYVFQVEMAYVAQRLGYRILEIPIHFEDRQIGRSKMSLDIKLEAAWRVWQVGLRHRRLRPSDRILED
jgi:dolichol-phosphate mannosyltransferase